MRGSELDGFEVDCDEHLRLQLGEEATHELKVALFSRYERHDGQLAALRSRRCSCRLEDFGIKDRGIHLVKMASAHKRDLNSIWLAHNVTISAAETSKETSLRGCSMSRFSSL